MLINGNLAGQAISLAFYALLCRIYPPEAFGTLAMFMSFAGLFGIASTGGYKYALLLPQNEMEEGLVHKLLAICLICCLSAAILSLPLFGLWAYFRGYFSADGTYYMAACAALLPIYVFSIGLWETLYFRCTKTGRFRLMAGMQAGQNLLSSSLKALCSLWTKGTGLIIGSSLGQFTASAAYAAANARDLREAVRRRPFGELKTVAARFSAYPKYSMTRDCINYMASNLIFFILGSDFEMEQIGFLSMALTMSLRPLILVINALNQNIMNKAGGLLASGKSLRPFIWRYLAAAAAAAIPAFAILWFAVPPLVSLLLGCGWESTATYIRYFLPWLCMLSIFQPLCNICDLIGKQKTDMAFELGAMLLCAAVLGTGLYFGDFDAAVIAYAACSLLIILIRGSWYVHIAVAHKPVKCDEK